MSLARLPRWLVDTTAFDASTYLKPVWPPGVQSTYPPPDFAIAYFTMTTIEAPLSNAPRLTDRLSNAGRTLIVWPAGLGLLGLLIVPPAVRDTPL